MILLVLNSSKKFKNFFTFFSMQRKINRQESFAIPAAEAANVIPAAVRPGDVAPEGNPYAGCTWYGTGAYGSAQGWRCPAGHAQGGGFHRQ